MDLAPLFPDTLMLGMEIRVKVSDYVRERIAALRECVAAAAGAPPPLCSRPCALSPQRAFGWAVPEHCGGSR